MITPASRAANFTNEAGVGGRTRFLRNVGGLWLLQESMRAWADEGVEQDLAELLDDAAALPSGGPTVDVDDPTFIPPGDMPQRIRDAAGAGGEGRLGSPAAITACIVESLAAGYARTVAAAAQLAGRRVEHDPHRRRWSPERIALSTHGHPVRCTGRPPARWRRRRSATCASRRWRRARCPDDLDEVRRLVGRNLEVVSYTPGSV